jgi:hypothetical protein
MKRVAEQRHRHEARGCCSYDRVLLPRNPHLPLSTVHFQHPDQLPCAAALPQTHPLKTRIYTLLQALHFMRDWQVNPFYRGFRHLPCPFLVSWDPYSSPAPKGRTHARAVNGPSFKPIITRKRGMSPKKEEKGNVSSFLSSKSVEQPTWGVAE